MRLLLAVSVIALAGCGGTSDDGSPAATPASASTDTAPDGSLGRVTIRVAESDAEGAPFSEVAGYLPAPIPDGAIPMTDLDAVPSYHVGVDRSGMPDDALSGTHFLYVKRKADGSLDRVRLLRGRVGLSDNHAGGSYTGSVGGFTFAPLWPEGGPTPLLTFDTMGEDKRQIATAPLTVIGRPVWAQPITLPATVEDPTVTAELDISGEDLSGLGVTLYLLYRQADSSGGDAAWSLEDFRRDRSTGRQRADDPSAPTTAPYLVYPDHLGSGPTEAYLLAFSKQTAPSRRRAARPSRR